RRPAIAEHDVSCLHTHDELDALLPEWSRLYEASAAPNPFADPHWLAVWARHYAPDAALELVTVRDRGELVGVAPLYRPASGRLPPERWRLLGSADQRQLNELPQLVVDADRTRDALRSIFLHLVGRGGEFDWLNFVLTPGQGWTQPDWFDVAD